MSLQTDPHDDGPPQLPIGASVSEPERAGPDGSGAPAAFADVPATMAPAARAWADDAERLAARTPPHLLEAEKAVLGTCLRHPETAVTVLSRVTTAHFYVPSHQEIFEAFGALAEQGHPIGAVSVLHQLNARGSVDKIGGPAYLEALRQAAGLSSHLPHHLRILNEYAAQRGVRESLLAASADAARGLSAAFVADNLRQRLDQIPRPAEDGIRDAPGMLSDLLDTLDARSGAGRDDAPQLQIKTGFRDLDDLIGGFRPGQLVVIAAPPGTGKSTVCLDFMRAAAIRQGLPSLMVALEMSTLEIAERLLAAEAKVLYDRIRTRPGELDDDDWAAIGRRIGEISEAQLYVDDTAQTVADARAAALMIKRRHGLAVLAVDHLHLLRTATSSSRRSRNDEVAEMTGELKRFSREQGILTLLPAQMNQDRKHRQSKRPVLTDIRDSGAVVQDADIVIAPYREDLEDRDSPRVGEIDFEVLKNRGGRTGRVTAIWQGHYARVVDAFSG